MPGATSTVTVDGVEPSIQVKLLNISDNPSKVKIFTADDGTERWLVKESDEFTLVTPSDLGVLGSVGIEVVHPQKKQEVEKQNEQQQKPAEGVVKVSPATPLGQSSPQA